MKLTMADETKRLTYWELAKDWSEQQDWRYYKNDIFAAVKGVAEYLANEDGYTLFLSYVGREYVSSNARNED